MHTPSRKPPNTAWMPTASITKADRQNSISVIAEHRVAHLALRLDRAAERREQPRPNRTMKAA